MAVCLLLTEFIQEVVRYVRLHRSVACRLTSKVNAIHTPNIQNQKCCMLI